MRKIEQSALVPMEMFEDRFPLRVQLAYAEDAPPNIFGQIYASNASLWLHRDLAKIVLMAAKIAHQRSGVSFVLYDGLRTSDAQAKMAESDIVKANPGWMEAPRLLSPAGSGAHPRGMAIDISLTDKDGALLDMGTVFDHLSENPHQDHNPAHRRYSALAALHQQNRAILDNAMAAAANKLGLPLYPLPQEWWDFRMPEDVYGVYAPLSDADLPPEIRMVSTEPLADFEEKYAPRVHTLAEEVEKAFN
jgi:D-alanyl-D-alanine dipeptidase